MATTPRQDGEHRPPFARIVAAIRGRIESGDLRPGDRVPSTREITRDWGVAMATATKALAALRHEGLVQATPGSGTTVLGRPRRTTSTPREKPRNPPPNLNQAAIVRTAMAVADAEGLTALSIRRVSSELGVSTMALYRHIADKNDLVALITDAAFTEIPLPEPPSHWRLGLEIAARRDWAMFQRHPWIVTVVSVRRPMLIPGGMAHTEWMMRVLGADRPGRHALAMHAIVTVIAFVAGLAGWFGAESDEEQETGVDNDQWWVDRTSELAELEATERFPLLFSAAEPPDLQANFEFGLARLLDGLAPFFDR